MPAFAAAAMVAATVVPPNPGEMSEAPRFQGETLTASGRPARVAHSSSERPTRSRPSNTATTAGVAPCFAQASHCRATASIAAAFGRPCVMTADSRATTAPPAAKASWMVGATSRLLTGSILRGYISFCPAGVAELVQAHGLGLCGASHGGSSPLARTIQQHHRRRREFGKSAIYREMPKLPPTSKFPPLEKDPFDTDDEIQQFSKVSGQSVAAQAR